MGRYEACTVRAFLMIGLCVALLLSACSEAGLGGDGDRGGGDQEDEIAIPTGKFAVTGAFQGTEVNSSMRRVGLATEAAPDSVVAIPVPGDQQHMGDPRLGLDLRELFIDPIRTGTTQVPIKADGSFSLFLEPGGDWLLLAVDTDADGPDRIVGYLVITDSETSLSTVPSYNVEPGSAVNLGDLHYSQLSGVFESETQLSELASTLNMSAAELQETARATLMTRMLASVWLNDDQNADRWWIPWFEYSFSQAIQVGANTPDGFEAQPLEVTIKFIMGAELGTNLENTSVTVTDPDGSQYRSGSEGDLIIINRLFDPWDFDYDLNWILLDFDPTDLPSPGVWTVEVDGYPAAYFNVATLSGLDSNDKPYLYNAQVDLTFDENELSRFDATWMRWDGQSYCPADPDVASRYLRFIHNGNITSDDQDNSENRWVADVEYPANAEPFGFSAEELVHIDSGVPIDVALVLGEPGVDQEKIGRINFFYGMLGYIVNVNLRNGE